MPRVVGIEFVAEEFPVYFALGVDWGAVVYQVLRGIVRLQKEAGAYQFVIEDETSH
jgi:hypothetical protein